MLYKNFFKRLIDILVSFIGLLALSPIMLFITMLLLFANRGKPFFTQQRPGKDMRVFRVVKFKTMDDKRDIHGNLLPDGERLTRIGKLIRSTSLDELPQLLNVLKGDMSLVGPRPLLVKYLPLYNKHQARRHEVRPGITGWAQVNGRNAISWQERFNLDVYYAENLSLALDVRIIFLTFRKVMEREGINANDTTTMEAFKGN